MSICVDSKLHITELTEPHKVISNNDLQLPKEASNYRISTTDDKTWCDEYYDDENATHDNNDQTQYLQIQRQYRDSKISSTGTPDNEDHETQNEFKSNWEQTTSKLEDQDEYDENIQDNNTIQNNQQNKPQLVNDDTFIIKELKDTDTCEYSQIDTEETYDTSNNVKNTSNKLISIDEEETKYTYEEINTIDIDNDMDETELEDIDKPLPLPYKSGCVHKAKYFFKSFLIIHPRIYALYLLFVQTWPRILVFVDMITDALLAYELYRGQQRFWFMLSSLFLMSPFILVWSASLRFIQLKVQKWYDRLNLNKSKRLSLFQSIINIFLMFYMFPPIGCILMVVAELFWVMSDLFIGVKAFVFGTGLIQTENREIKAMKSYRRAVEVFSESVPQSLLQFYIFIRLSILEKRTENATYQGVSANALYLSFGVSIINVFYNFYKFKKEAQLHGMSWSEYSLSVLQLAEIPTIKLVPRIPAIKKGYIEEANFAGFKFDKQSITPLMDAINNTKCKLKTIKVSIRSLSKLDIHSCKYLGNLLHNTRIKVLISRCSSLLDVKDLFDSIDSNRKGYLNENDFFNALEILNCSIQNESKKFKKRLFQKLAIRRLPQRDRLYWTDFFKITASVKKRNDLQVDFDLTQIDYPLHFMCQQMHDKIENNEDEDSAIINNFNKLYQFCDGLSMLDKIDNTTSCHIFYSIVDLFAVLCHKKKSYPKYTILVAKIFKKLLTSNAFDGEFYVERNKIFINHKYIQVLDRNNKFKQSEFNNAFVDELMKLNGCNIFEYCFLYSPKCRSYQCKAFAHLLNAWLAKIDPEQIKYSIIDGGPLYYLFHNTNGFHLFDNEGHSPLYYAAKHKLENLISFYSKHVFKIELNNEWQWVNDQVYLHGILHVSVKTNSSIKSIFLLLSSIDLLYTLNDKPLAHHMLIYRSCYPIYKDYILEYMKALEDFHYDFTLTDSKGSNLLHYAISLKDIDAAKCIINLQSADSYSDELLNHKNNLDMTPLQQAIRQDCTDIVKLLIMNKSQKNIDFQIFADKLKENKKTEKWIECLHDLIVETNETNDSILNKMSRDMKENLFQEFHKIHQKPKSSRNNHKRILTQEMNTIYGVLESHVDNSSSLLLNLTIPSNQSRNSASYAADSFSSIRHIFNNSNSSIHYKDLYLKAISNQNNSCFGFNHISPKDAAYVWLVIDFML
eukprot:295081_1